MTDWNTRTVNMNYDLGRRGDRDLRVAEGTGLVWCTESGSMQDPRERFHANHLESTHVIGPCFFSQEDVERYIGLIAPMHDWSKILEELRLIEGVKEQLETAAQSLGCEYAWDW